ncbi:MAG: 2-isopropylmalate synthase [Candidatus Omnitrophica bacterium]|nr:2-isopropylmalate synthase [Candidatus Omnitrophota bacterium]
MSNRPIDSNRVRIFDTTLRDGEQSPGASMNTAEKLEVAALLAELGVDIIEAGFPISSEGDFEAVKAIAERIEGPTIAGLARAVPADIDRCWEAVKHNPRPRIHTFIATSQIHLEKKLRKSPEEVIQFAVEAVKRARGYCEDVEFSTEDAARTSPDYICEIVERTIEAGATTINIPDTVGYSNPWEYGRLIEYVFEKVPNVHDAIISVHCHNDMGLAVANSLAAVRAGARQVECTINGIGERAGNASLEEIVMNLATRKDFFGYETGIRTEKIYRASRLVSNITGLVVQPNKAIVGQNAFAHEAGIHQDGMIKDKSTYEIMTPESVGWRGTSMVMGKHSGRHAFVQRLKELGFILKEEQVQLAFHDFKDLADRKKDVFDEDLEAICRRVQEETEETDVEMYKLVNLETSSSMTENPKAHVTIKKGSETLEGSGEGDGPVDAACKAIKEITGTPSRLVDFRIAAITGGTDAQGSVSLTVEENDIRAVGRFSGPDIIAASAQAYIQALNSLESKKASRARGESEVSSRQP